MTRYGTRAWLVGFCSVMVALAMGCPSNDEKASSNADGGGQHSAQGSDAATDEPGDGGDAKKAADAQVDEQDAATGSGSMDASEPSTEKDASTDPGATDGKGIGGKVGGDQVQCPNIVAAGVSAVALNVTGVQASGAYPGMTITLGAAGGVKAGTKYDCTAATNTVSYTDETATTYYANSAAGSCEVTFTEIGDAIGKPLKGTFSATLETIDGSATKTIEAGTVDTSLLGFSN